MTEHSKPSHDRISITKGGEQVELFMSFGLLNELMVIVSDLPNVSLMGLQAELRNTVLHSILSVRDNTGSIIEDYNPFAVEIPADDILKVISWASEHVLSFFLNAMEGNLKVHSAHEGAIASMASGRGLPR